MSNFGGVCRTLCCATVLIGFGGCSHFSQEFSCGAEPFSSCAPVSEVYKKTNGEVMDYRVEGQSSAPPLKKRKRHLNTTITVGQAHRVMNYRHPGDPLLTKPLVLRVLYRGFQTEDDHYDAGGYVFIKMRDSSWTIDQSR